MTRATGSAQYLLSTATSRACRTDRSRALNRPKSRACTRSAGLVSRLTRTDDRTPGTSLPSRADLSCDTEITGTYSPSTRHRPTRSVGWQGRHGHHVPTQSGPSTGHSRTDGPRHECLPDSCGWLIVGGGAKDSEINSAVLTCLGHELPGRRSRRPTLLRRGRVHRVRAVAQPVTYAPSARRRPRRPMTDVPTSADARADVRADVSFRRPRRRPRRRPCRRPCQRRCRPAPHAAAEHVRRRGLRARRRRWDPRAPDARSLDQLPDVVEPPAESTASTSPTLGGDGCS